MRSRESGETDPEQGGSRLEHSAGSRGEHDQGSGLGLAWRPTGPGVRAVSSTPAPVSVGMDVSANSPLRVILTFGRRQVNVSGSLRMSVGELRTMAGSIADLDPASFLLMHGELVLQLCAVLDDYVAFVGSMGFHVTVVISPGALPGGPIPRPVNSMSRMGSSPASPPNPPQTGLATSPLFSPSVPESNSYLILVILEDGRTLQPVVWGTMQVRHLCRQVAEFARVPSDTVPAGCGIRTCAF